MPTVGKQVRELRDARGWTQVQLGVYAGISPSTVNLIEHGHRNPNAVTLQKLAHALGVEPGNLFAEPVEESDLPPVLEGWPEGLKWALEATSEEMEARATGAEMEELEVLKSLFDERLKTLREVYGAGRYSKLETQSPEKRKADEEALAIRGRRSVIIGELRRRNPSPAATITRFAPEANRRPLVRWLIPEEERDAWRERLDAKLPEGYDEEEAEPQARGEGKVELLGV